MEHQPSSNNDCHLFIQLTSSDQYFEPLTRVDWNKQRKFLKSQDISLCKNSRTLFSDNPQYKDEQVKQKTNEKNRICHKDSLLGNIMKNTNKKMIENKQKTNCSQSTFEQNYHFKQFSKSYVQTPIFKKILQTPLSSFHQRNNSIITNLRKNKSQINSANFKSLPLQENPLNYKKNGATFFVGLSITMKNQNHKNLAIWFYKLACFIQPFNESLWQGYIDILKKYNMFHQAFIASKTGFLFKQTSQLGMHYLTLGEHLKHPMHKLRGILSSLKQPQYFEKILIQSARLQIKNRKPWRGIILLIQFCFLNDFKPGVCQAIILLCKQLQNRGYRTKALQYLRLAFSRSLSALQAYQLYLQLLVRQKYGNFSNKDFQYLQKICQYLSQQTRYKFCLDICEYVKDNNQIFCYWVKKSFNYLQVYCKKGCGKKRALRILYFTLLRLKNCPIINIIPKQYLDDNSVMFQNNRYSYIQTGQLSEYEFTQWKFYIHYSLFENAKMVEKGANKWPQIGRLAAQQIHLLRKTKQPIVMLNFWRRKIESIPKSGQLWCEGGRIYLQIGQIQNAIKCFKYAIHFTPEYGDSFFELLKVYLYKNNHQQIHKLYNSYLICEPVYGCLSTFWRYSGQSNGYPFLSRLSLRETWELAKNQIKEQLYESTRFRLSASMRIEKLKSNCYNIKIRQKLFLSYEQFDKKS